MRPKDEELERALRLFDELIELEPPARRGRLLEVGTDDPSLRDRVVSLLRHAESGAVELHPDAQASLRQLGRDVDLCCRWPQMAREDAEDRVRAQEELRRQLRGSSDRYDLGSPIGRGGMGTVYRAEDRWLRRTVAMKVIRRPVAEMSGREAGRYLDEARLTAQLDHPAIVPMYDVGLDANDRVFFTMKLIEEPARTLHALLGDDAMKGDWRDRTGRLLPVVLQVAEAVSFAHRKQIFHRDLTPRNIMVGEGGEAYVMDWGIARAWAADDVPFGDDAEVDAGSLSLTAAGRVVGTPGFVAPERSRDDPAPPSAQTDVYSIGAVLFTIVAGACPQPNPVSLASLAPGAPGELVAIVDKAMATDLERRYKSLDDFAADVRAFVEGKVVAAHDTSPWMALRKWLVRHRFVVLASASAVVLTVALATLQTERRARLERLERSNAAFGRGCERSARGFLEDARAAFAAAEADGYPDPVGLALERVELLDSAGESDSGRALLESMRGLSAAELGAHRARYLLYRGDRSRESWAKLMLDGTIADVDAAIADGGLAPADAAYAEALRSSSFRDAMGHLDRALLSEPRHRRAREMQASLMLYWGEPNVRRVAEAYLLTRPSDPSAQILALVCRSLAEGRIPDNIDVEYPDLDEPPLAAIQTFLTVINMTRDSTTTTAEIAVATGLGEKVPPNLHLNAALRIAHSILWLPSGSDSRVEVVGRIPPRLAVLYTQAAVRSLKQIMLGTDREQAARDAMPVLDQLVAGGAGGLWHYFRALAKATLGDRFAAREDLYLAATLPSPIPVRRMCLVLVLLHQYNHPDPALEQRAVGIAEVLPAEFDLTSSEYRLLWAFYNSRGMERWRREIVARWNRLYPADPNARYARAEEIVQSRQLRKACDELRAILADVPDHEPSQDLLAALQRALGDG